MPVQWTTDMDRRLFLITLEQLKVDKQKIADRWSEKYEHEGGAQPTARAISERIGKLKQMAAGNGNGGSSNAGAKGTKVSTPLSKSTPRKSKPVKTPTSSAKRGRKAAMSDEDDSEDERNMLNGNGKSPSKRAKYERHTKVPKTYGEPSSEDEFESLAGMTTDLKPVFDTRDTNGSTAKDVGSTFDQELNLDGMAEEVTVAPHHPNATAAANGMAKEANVGLRRKDVVADADAMSDVSDYQPEIDLT